MKGDIFTDIGASTAGFVFAKFPKLHSLLIVKFAYLYKLKLADNNLALIVIYCA